MKELFYLTEQLEGDLETLSGSNLLEPLKTEIV